MNKKPLRYHTYSIQGNRKTNADHIAISTFADKNTAQMNRGEMFIIADGIGEHHASRQVAQLTCERLLETYYSPEFEFEFDDPLAVEAVLKRIFFDINDYIESIGRQDSSLFGWGTAVSVLVIGTGCSYFIHSGDTRIFHINGGEAELLTEDQNVAYQMLKYQQISYQEYLTGIGHNKLLSYIGVGQGVSIQTGRGYLGENDYFLLCSDGFNQFCQIHDLQNIVQKLYADTSKQKLDFFEALYTLLTESIIEEKTAMDNVSFVLLAVT